MRGVIGHHLIIIKQPERFPRSDGTMIQWINWLHMSQQQRPIKSGISVPPPLTIPPKKRSTLYPTYIEFGYKNCRLWPEITAAKEMTVIGSISWTQLPSGMQLNPAKKFTEYEGASEMFLCFKAQKSFFLLQQLGFECLYSHWVSPELNLQS